MSKEKEEITENEIKTLTLVICFVIGLSIMHFVFSTFEIHMVNKLQMENTNLQKENWNLQLKLNETKKSFDLKEKDLKIFELQKESNNIHFPDIIFYLNCFFSRTVAGLIVFPWTVLITSCYYNK